jgi:sec-independent protein translocase protein TatC
MSARSADFNPDDFQMSIGDHLEELRRRLLLGLIGLLPAVIVCMLFGRQMLAILCRPLTAALQRYDISPQIYTDELSDAFMVYIKLSMIAALAIAGPWIVYQLWQFVSAGLYPRERKYVTRYIPLSIALLITGMVFVYFVVLPFSLQFFITFTMDLPLVMPTSPQARHLPATAQPTYVQSVAGNPQIPKENQIWFDTEQNRLKMFVGGKVRVIPFGPDNLVATHFTLPDYLDLVLQLLLSFGLAFQLPLVVMALARIGIVEIATLKKWRRFMYLGLAVLAAALAPGDVVTATIALLIPLILLYELGIFLAKMGPIPEPRPTAT